MCAMYREIARDSTLREKLARLGGFHPHLDKNWQGRRTIIQT